MGKAKMNVQLLDVMPDALAVIYAAGKQCYSDKFAIEFKNETDEKKMEEFVRRLIQAGHESPLEHVKFTFAIEGVSRVLTHQLVRHRIASYSQQSQRFVKMDDFDFIIPPSIEADEVAREEFLRLMEEIKVGYRKIRERLERIKGKEASEDARFVLPQAVETKIVVTMNVRELLHFFRERCCARAQWEIRELANRMLAICKEYLPAVFDNAGAKCVHLGYCPEGKKFSCGKYPLKEDVLSRRLIDKEEGNL
ncbi:FAD-dependent thymidylate synthase [bacterium]|nr:FAD-dependent thymidylate synthase [bacterium]